VRAGLLRHRVNLQQAVEARNGFGDVIRTWSTVATVWGSVNPLSGREYLAARQALAETTTRIQIRYRADIDETWRVTWGSHVYDIDVVLADPMHAQHLTLMVHEVTS
jgi:SPP1 family predicted phage head-tail adaptor